MQKIQQKLQEIPQSSNTVFEWRNTKSIISQSADEIWEKYKAFPQMKKLKTLDDEIKLIVKQKNLAYKKYLQTKTIEKETEYRHRRAIAKRETRKNTSQILGTIHIIL
jgi:hypothetical protein